MRTIRSKITLTFILVSAAITGLLGILLSIEIEKSFFERLIRQLESETLTVETLVDGSIARGDTRATSIALLQGLAQGFRSRITLIDHDGKVGYDSGVADSLLHTLENHGTRPEVLIARERGGGWNKRHSNSTGDELFYYARALPAHFPQPSSFAQVEFIRVAISSREVDQAIMDIYWKIAAAVLAVLFAVIAVSWFVAARLVNPIKEIGDIVREIQAGNLDRKIPVRSEDEIGRLSALVNELTDKLKADVEQVKRLETIRSEFLGNVSHELRTPIFSLKGFLETLLDGAVNDPSVNTKFVEKAYHHASRLDHLLSDLIEISRIESGEMKLSLRYFDAVSFLRAIVQDYHDQAAGRVQTIKLEVPDSEVMVLGDRDRLRLAAGNIIDNALKYSDEHSVVTVTLTVSDQTATITVSDRGPGIEEEHLSRIFERFYRVDKNRSREVGGTGLGLAIVKHIVEAHGSKIDVSSIIGKGSSFSFELRR